MSPRSLSIPPHLPPKKRKRSSVLLALAWYSPAIHRGIMRFAREANWILDTSLERHRNHYRAWGEDGIICHLHANDSLYQFVKNTRKPVVNIGVGEQPPIPNIRADTAQIGIMAADYFYERGFRHMAFVRKSHSPASLERYHAFHKRAVEKGCAAHLIDWLAYSHNRVDYSERKMIRWIGQAIKELPKPLAILTENDEQAVEVIYACHGVRIPIPDQVVVLGSNNDPLRCEFAPVPLSSIDTNLEVMGYEAAALLDRIMHGGPKPEAPVLIPPVGVVTRLSTDIMAIKHPHVASALKYIWQHYTERINAKTVAATVPLSYQRLHSAFIENVGRTIAEEITHKRMEKAQRLLIETDKKGYDIALECGFPNDDRMGRIFKRVLGMTPMEYRQCNRQTAK
jgi:LacI family transcriptional regulator